MTPVAIKLSQRCLSFGGATIVAGIASQACAQTGASLDVSAGVRAATNPYLETGSTPTGVAATLEVMPRIEFGGPATTVRLDGSGRLDEYFENYGTDVSGRARIGVDHRMSERTSLGLSGSFSTTLGALNGAFGSNDLTRDPQLSDASQLALTDLTVTGTRLRQYSYGGGARMMSRISLRGTVEAGGEIMFSKFRGPLAQNHRDIVVDAGYSHIIDDRKSVGVRVSYSNNDYRKRLSGDGYVISPNVTAAIRVNATVSLNLAAGASFAKIRQANGVYAKSTGFSGQATLCHKGEKLNSCVTASRSVQATSLGGMSNVIMISTKWDLRLREKDTVSFGANYGRTSQPAASAAQFGPRSVKVAGASITYAKQVSQRVFLTVSPSFDKSWGQAVRREANYQIMAGIRYRFGRA